MSKAQLTESGLPARVREIVADLLVFCRQEIAARIETTLDQLDVHLLRLHDQARDTHIQRRLLRAHQSLRENRNGYAEAFFGALDARLTALRRPVSRRGSRSAGAMLPSALWAIEDRESDDAMSDARLRELSMPLESASSLPLYLLGQRFGVLAAAPAFPAEQIVIGPRILLEIAGEAALHLFNEHLPIPLLQEEFARQVLVDYPGFVERANARLEEAGVLRGLAFVPARLPKSARRAGVGIVYREDAAAPPEMDDGYATAAPAEEPAAAAGYQPAPAARLPALVQTWMEQPVALQAPASPPSAGLAAPPAVAPSMHASAQATHFQQLQQLLSAHRVVGQPLLYAGHSAQAAQAAQAPPSLELGEIDSLLEEMQVHDGVSFAYEGGIAHAHAQLLARARSRHGENVTLGREDADAFEILSLLYAEVAREVRPGSPILGLLARLQLPLLRLVLHDRSFFDLPEHPARLLLNTIAESDASIYADHPVDPYFETIMQRVVSRLESGYRGQPELLAQVNDELHNELQQQIRRAQANERRLIEAANGRERMILAKRGAARMLEAQMQGMRLSPALDHLIGRAWLDALTLAVLRNGQDSNVWHSHVEMTQRILAIVTSEGPASDPELAGDIEAAMLRVGYHEDEARSVAFHLARPGRLPEADGSHGLEALAARVRDYARFGEEDAEPEPAAAETTGAEVDSLDELRLGDARTELRLLPFGTWLDFTDANQPAPLRRRLSWFSTETGRALLVNRRGQRIAEVPLETLAAQMAAGMVAVVQAQDIRLVDRAMRATATLLRNSLRGGQRGAFAAMTP